MDGIRYRIVKIKNGVILDNNYQEDIVYFVDSNNKGLAIYKKYDKDVNKLKPWKML
jgi:hypothetical protein